MHSKSNLSQWKVFSPLGGALYLVASDRAITGLYWKKQSIPMSKTPLIQKAMQELEEYFSGKRKEFNIPLDFKGTEFQQRVWQELQRIPFGKTISYSQLAKKIKNEKAVRAVGTANGRNPICIMIPCHRVIAANGSLGGYAGGLKLKEFLLKLENTEF